MSSENNPNREIIYPQLWVSYMMEPPYPHVGERLRGEGAGGGCQVRLVVAARGPPAPDETADVQAAPKRGADGAKQDHIGYGIEHYWQYLP